MTVYIAKIDARCSSATPWGVVDEAGTLVACHLIEDDARRDASNRMDPASLVGGKGMPPGLPMPTQTIVKDAPLRQHAPGGTIPGTVLTPDAGGPVVPHSMGPLAGKGGGWTAGRGIAEDEMETRAARVLWPLSDLEIRSEGDGMHFRGYAAVFNSESQPLPWIETIEPKAFARSLGQDRDIKMFFNHNPNQLLGTRKAGTLRLTEDQRGLLVDADLPDTTSGRDLSVLVKRGDVDNMSFTFKKDGPNGDAWSEDGSRRSLRSLKLFEVSPMTEWAAYQGTTASVRSLGVMAQRLNAREADLLTAFRKLTEGRSLSLSETYLVSKAALELSSGDRRGWSSAASDAASGAQALSSLLYLLSSESDEPDQVEMLRNSIGWLQTFINAEMTEVGSLEDQSRGLTPTNVAKARLALLARA